MNIADAWRTELATTLLLCALCITGRARAQETAIQPGPADPAAEVGPRTQSTATANSAQHTAARTGQPTAQPTNAARTSSNATYQDLDRQAQSRDRASISANQASQRSREPAAGPTRSSSGGRSRSR